MKDLFSDNSQLYQQARPDYSAEILEAVLKCVPERQLAWDCGAGSGQFTQWLAPHFQQVLATDLSAAQLAQAPQLQNVICRAAAAEHSGLPDHSADLVTVAQAIHWFNFDAFYAEVRRVLKALTALNQWPSQKQDCHPLRNYSSMADLALAVLYCLH